MALQKYSGNAKNKIIGMAGILDSFKIHLFFIQRIGRYQVNKIKSFVLGRTRRQHGANARVNNSRWQKNY